MMFLLLEKKKRRQLKGFSIGEVLLAAFVLTSGLMATSALMATSLHNSFETRDAIIATQLSQEGVELVRNFRDNDFADNENGFSDNLLFHTSQKRCRLDYDDSLSPSTCNNESPSDPLFASRYILTYSASGFYRHAVSPTGRFSRYIYIDYDRGEVLDQNDDTATVKSYVYWGSVIPNFPANGNSSDCIITALAQKCVYTEVTLTSWKQ